MFYGNGMYDTLTSSRDCEMSWLAKSQFLKLSKNNDKSMPNDWACYVIIVMKRIFVNIHDQGGKYHGPQRTSQWLAVGVTCPVFDRENILVHRFPDGMVHRTQDWCKRVLAENRGQSINSIDSLVLIIPSWISDKLLNFSEPAWVFIYTIIQWFYML